MGDALNDVVTVFLLGVAAWVFLPAGARAVLVGRVGPAALALADLVRRGLPVLEAGAYHVIVGRPKVSRVSVPAEESRPMVGESHRFPSAPEPPRERTNEPANAGRTALAEAAEALQLDKTRGAVVAVLVAAGWGTTDIRELLKGTASDIGAEAKAAREALDARAAGEPEARTLRVRDGSGERVIAM